MCASVNKNSRYYIRPLQSQAHPRARDGNDLAVALCELDIVGTVECRLCRLCGLLMVGAKFAEIDEVTWC